MENFNTIYFVTFSAVANDVNNVQNKMCVLSLLEAYLDLISGSSLHMKIQITGGKITENLGFKSPLRKVKIFCPFFIHFQILHKNCISFTIFSISYLQSRFLSIKPKIFIMFYFISK